MSPATQEAKKPEAKTEIVLTRPIKQFRHGVFELLEDRGPIWMLCAMRDWCISELKPASEDPKQQNQFYLDMRGLLDELANSAEHGATGVGLYFGGTDSRKPNNPHIW